MRSRSEPRDRRRAACALLQALRALVLGAIMVSATMLPLRADAQASSPASGAAPTAREVLDIVAALNAASAPAPTHTEHRLRWRDENKEDVDRTPPSTPWLITFLMRVAGWIAGAGRGVVWFLGAVAVALLAVFAWRLARVRGLAGRDASALPPSHVHALDIRPESLPADIAGEARRLASRSELRAALSLLYRGSLSRLVHGLRARITAASTEGECVQIARALLSSAGGVYVAQLVGAWQTTVYAGRAVAIGEVLALCDGFDRHMVPAPATVPTSALPPKARTA